jgi:predicted transcriptional regulator
MDEFSQILNVIVTHNKKLQNRYLLLQSLKNRQMKQIYKIENNQLVYQSSLFYQFSQMGILLQHLCNHQVADLSVFQEEIAFSGSTHNGRSQPR